MHPLYSIVHRSFYSNSVGQILLKFHSEGVACATFSIKIQIQIAVLKPALVEVGAKSVVASSEKEKRRFQQSHAIIL